MITTENIRTSRLGEALKSETCEGFRNNNRSTDYFFIADSQAKSNSYPGLATLFFHGEFF
jgi:hypothetical protein